jgi:hypothetical protein
MTRKNVTLIENLDDLPDIQEFIDEKKMPTQNNIIPEEHTKSIYNKFIRNHNRTPVPQSGMINPDNSSFQPETKYSSNYHHPQQYHQYQEYYPSRQYDPQQYNYPQQYNNNSQKTRPIPYTKNMVEKYDNDEDDVENVGTRLNKCIYINCRDISCHVSECPVCCKLYKSDNTFYIVIIVILSLVVLFLLQKLFYINKIF